MTVPDPGRPDPGRPDPGRSDPGRPDQVDPSDAALRAQFEAFPYPARDPRDEDRRLVTGSPGHLRELDHWIWGARRPAGRPLRALIAGGGTGDGAIMLATGLADANRSGRVLHLDRAVAATAIARARAGRRQLDNIDFVTGALDDPPTAVRAAAPFDYIDCCGVLHHLPDPAGALAGLRALLAPDGGIGLMVYAPHGRGGVYELQAALRLLAPVADPPADRLAIARRVLRHDTVAVARLRANHGFGDHLTGGDAGLYDLLLSGRDQPFTVPALARLVGAAGLRIAVLIEPSRYDPALLLPDPVLRARAAALAPLERAALAEALAGDHATHIAYLRHADAPDPAPPDPLDPDAVPVARDTPAPALADRIGRDGTYPAPFGALRLPLPPRAGAVLRLVDGVRPVAALRTAAAALGIDAGAFDRLWPASFTTMAGVNRLLWRAPP